MRILQITLAVCVFATAVVAAENPFLGTWKVNTAKSQFSPGPGPQSLTVTFSQDGDQVMRTAQGVDGEGKPISMKGGIKWDGQDHPVETPTGTATTVAAKIVNERTVEYTVKTNGKVTTTGRAVLSRDGKISTSTESGVNAKGEKVHNVVVSERQ
jgi:hypothetical protein